MVKNICKENITKCKVTILEIFKCKVFPKIKIDKPKHEIISKTDYEGSLCMQA